MRWAPFVTVAAVIREQDRYLLVEERPDGYPVINQPAGHLEFGESLLDAVQREVREETARRFTPNGLVGVYQWTVPDSARSFLRFCFCGSVSAPLPGAALDPDIHATHWLSVEEITSGALPTRSPLVLRCIHDTLRGPPLGLDALHALS
jgi:ADP-ribose pyrophosphatase YjhB (NUDIX family)